MNQIALKGNVNLRKQHKSVCDELECHQPIISQTAKPARRSESAVIKSFGLILLICTYIFHYTT